MWRLSRGSHGLKKWKLRSEENVQFILQLSNSILTTNPDSAVAHDRLLADLSLGDILVEAWEG